MPSSKYPSCFSIQQREPGFGKEIFDTRPDHLLISHMDIFDFSKASASLGGDEKLGKYRLSSRQAGAAKDAAS